MSNWIIDLKKDVRNDYSLFTDLDESTLATINVTGEYDLVDLEKPAQNERVIVIANNRHPIGLKVFFAGDMLEGMQYYEDYFAHTNIYGVYKYYIESLSNPEQSFLMIVAQENICQVGSLLDAESIVELTTDREENIFEKDRRLAFAKVIETTFCFLQKRLNLNHYWSFDRQFWTEAVPGIYEQVEEILVEYNKNFNKVLGASILNRIDNRIEIFYRRGDLAWSESLLKHSMEDVLRNYCPAISMYPDEREMFRNAGVIDKYGWRLKSASASPDDDGDVLYVYNEE